tara:strand:- start:1852 stop:3846 length:1995 start_codon:yes stop_codon:yes gene_type:complete
MTNNNSSAEKISKRVSPFIASFFMLVTCLGITYFFKHIESRATNVVLQTYFDFRVREATRQISNRIEAYAEVLRATAGFYRASERVTRLEFNKFISTLGLADYYPGIQVVGVSIIIAPENLDTHIDTVRSQGFPSYSVYPAGDRDTYTSIIYLEPFSERNLRAFGFDMYSDPVRQDSMRKATESSNMSMTGAVRLVQESGVNDQVGFLMYLPIYAEGKPFTTLTERRENIIGWTYAAFRMNDFIQAANEQHFEDLDIEIYDGELISPQTLMYDSHDFHSQTETTLASLQAIADIKLVDHDWTFKISSLPSMSQRVDSNNASYISAIGIIISIFISFIVWLILTERQLAIATSKKVHKELIYEQQRLQNIIDGTRIGTWEWNIQTGETSFNEFWAAIVGYTLSELSPVSIKSWSNLVHPEDREKSDALLKKHFSGELPFYECEVRMRHKDGHLVWVLDRGKVSSRMSNGEPLLMFGTHEDISDRKEAEAILLYDIQHDPLTQLPNRSLLLDRLQRGILHAKRNSLMLAVMFIDLDRFKSINDTFGHDIGDKVLIEVANRIKLCLRESDTVARIGGDEFVVLLSTVESSQDAKMVAEKIRKTVSRDFNLQGRIMDVAASVGIAIYPEHGLDVETLMRNSDTAMYFAKSNGRNSVKLYENNLQGAED